MGLESLGGFRGVKDRDEGERLGCWGYGFRLRRVWGFTWVVLKIRVPFGVLNTSWHLIFRVPKKGTLILTTTHMAFMVSGKLTLKALRVSGLEPETINCGCEVWGGFRPSLAQWSVLGFRDWGLFGILCRLL